MRGIALVVLSGVALAACNPSAPGAGGGASSGGLPSLIESAYRAEITMTDPDEGRTMPAVMIRDGRKFRLEISSAEGAMTIVSNPETGEEFTIMGSGASQMAIHSTQVFDSPWDTWEAELSGATAGGPCSGAGQQGQIWNSQNDEGVANTACITGDGIILHASEAGVTTWETTSVQRGPQSADLFALPAGIQVMDSGAMGMTQAP